ncbi:MAG: hypothetical protein GQ564_06185 [Bacteroidales bacterium]|nr:hypothetical protein [Bacteroidales bacterium]
MQLHLFERFILITLDQKKGRFLIDSLSLNYGIAGAILLELSKLNKITLQNKRLIVKDLEPTNNIILDTCIKLINSSKKKRGAKFWIFKIGNKSSNFKKIILKELIENKILKINKETYLWGLMKFFRYPIINTNEIEELTTKLKKIVLEDKKPDIDGLLLLSLMNSCKLIRILFIKKKEHKAARKRIEELTRNIEISEDVRQTLKEIQTAIVAATLTTYVSP